MRYPISIEPDGNDTLLVTSPDFPELTTFGEDIADAGLRAADALVTVIAERIGMREPVPEPSTTIGPVAILSLTEGLKVALYQTMMSTNVGKAELARRLKVHLPQVDRLLDLHHASKVDALEMALRALGREVRVIVEAA